MSSKIHLVSNLFVGNIAATLDWALRLVILVAVLCLLAVSVAYAQTADPPTDSFLWFHGAIDTFFEYVGAAIMGFLLAGIGWVLQRFGSKLSTETKDTLKQQAFNFIWNFLQAQLVRAQTLASNLRVEVKNDMIRSAADALINQLGPSAARNLLGDKADIQRWAEGILGDISDQEPAPLVVREEPALPSTPAIAPTT